MSNVKDVKIMADVPFTWIQDLDEKDAAFVAGILLSPSSGLRHHYCTQGYAPNDKGGLTAVYAIEIVGHEAYSWPTLRRLAEIIHSASLHGLGTARARDVENEGAWEGLLDQALSGEIR